MSTFIDGPAAGVHLMLRRAPVMLRTVTTGGGKWDALDQPNDQPAADERIYLYRAVPGTAFGMHLNCGRGKNREAGGIYQSADYQFVEPQPDDVTLRDSAKWVEFCDALQRAEAA